jgi:hypothetical protein
MIFLAPIVLVGLAALPALYFLLRVTPPPPRRIAFPPVALLRDLTAEERTPRRMPLWLLLLRLAAAALVIIGLAGPSLHPAPALPGTGPILLVIDNGWAAAPDWTARRDAALRIIAAASQSGRGVALLPTSRDQSNQSPAIEGVMTADAARQLMLALQPQPWPADRQGAAAALGARPPGATAIYLADGITDGPGFPAFLRALRPDRVLSDGVAASLLTQTGLTADGDIAVHLANALPGAQVLAETADNAVLARTGFTPEGDAAINLPLALGSRIARLVLAGPPAAGGVLLLDGAAHGTLVALAAGSANAETPYTGALFFARRALPPGSQIVTGSLPDLIADKPGIIILADLPLAAADQEAAQSYLAQGGDIIRFAGPLTADSPDALSPDPLLPGDRRLGGALTWTAPQSLAPFPAGSPFAGLPLDATAKITRQVLADPTQLAPSTVWARLQDGTPLVLGASIGRGELVSVLTTANADWSSLALSGLYPAMLARLVALSHGAPARPAQKLHLAAALGAFGDLAAPAIPASIAAGDIAKITVSPLAPPGLYGAGGATVALNLGGHVPPIIAAALPGAAPLTGAPPPRDLGATLIGAALALLALDLLLSLRLRGLIRLPAFTAGLAALAWLAAPPARAQDAALATTIAYVITGDAATDQLSADGLNYLSAVVTSHSSARLGAPAGVTPGIDDLNLYPLLYWPVLPNAAPPSPAACAALVSYMQHGGLLVIDTEGGDPGDPGSGAGFSPGAAAALARDTACLSLPPLEPLTTANVLAHCFYIVPDFPGRFTGAPIYLATDAARDADGVTPVLIGQNDWVGAWAHDANGNPEQTPIPGGEDQRMIAERFGTNLVVYALTGSYKADQANLPEMLDKLGR